MSRPSNALIVDDEAHVRAFLRLLLGEVGVTGCWEAGDGPTAVLLAQQHQPELVLLDINLPGMNGLQVLEQLKAAHPNMPVVMVTAQSGINAVTEAARLGASGYVLKQAPKNEALAALRDVLDSLDEDAEEKA